MNNPGRMPPHSNEAEESVLGSILLDNESIYLALEKVKAEDFYKSAHKHIFEAMFALSEKLEPIDIITLSEELRRKSLLEQCGGMDYISHLTSLVPSSGNISYYSKIVRDMSVRRRLISEASTIIKDAFETRTELERFLDTVEQKILHIAGDRIGPGFSSVADIVQESIKIIEESYDKKEAITGTDTGFHNLNKLTAGFQKSDLIILAARPGMGKTSLAMSMAQSIGIEHGEAVAIFSLEMSKEQLVLRMLCSEAEVENSKVRTGFLQDRDFPRLVDAAGKIAEAPIYIDDSAALTVTDMRAKARRLHKEKKLSLIVVDYLQLMKSPLYDQHREQEIADISRSLKALAKELNIPVLALAQLNRAVEGRSDKRPMMADLRESGAIEQDADLIMFIYRDEIYNPDTEDKGVAEVILGKHRSGPTGTVRLGFHEQYTKFVNLDETHSDYTSPGNDSAERIIDLEMDMEEDMLG